MPSQGDIRARGTLAARYTRDAALRRTRAIVAGVAAAAVGLSGTLSVVAAHAFKGHSQGSSTAPVAKASDRGRLPRVSVPGPQRIPSISGQAAPLQPPAQPPAATPDTQPAPAPAPQVSGGS
jgi:hypothetical protein